jgi:hypothetical protein
MGVTVKEEHKLRCVQEQEYLRIFEFTREEVIGIWRKLHNKVLYGMYLL